MDSPSLDTSPLKDPRLREAAHLLMQDDVEVLSLDVFDTLLWRMVPEPVDAFILLGRQLRERGMLRATVSPTTFAALRTEAEKQAREDHPNPDVPEVSLEEIAALLARAVDIPPEDLVRAEVDFEKSLTVPDLEIAALARAARGLDKKLVLVSDTYFSPDQLRELLDRPALHDIDFDAVFTSSSRSTNKGDRLFEVVLKELELDGKAVVHVGDHPISDCASPGRLGIWTVHFHKFPGDLAHVIDREHGIKEGHIFRKVPRLHLDRGDLGLTAVRAKAASLYASEDVSPDLLPYWRFGSTVLGPVFTGFAEWVHARAAEESATRVFCLMREGEYLASVLNDVGPRIGSRVEAVPIWTSRRIYAEAAIRGATRSELEQFLVRREPLTVSGLCAALSLEPAEVPGLADLADKLIVHKDLSEEVLDRLSSEPARSKIVARSAEKRERLLVYLRRMFADVPGKVIVVDVGWGATIQLSLQRVLDLAGTGIETTGLYLLTGEAARARMLEGLRVEGYLDAAGATERVSRWVTRAPEVVEQVCMNDTGPLQGFDEHGNQLVGASTESVEQREQRKAVQHGIRSFGRLWHEYSPFTGGSLGADGVEFLAAMLLRLIIEPTESEARLFSTWMHDDTLTADEGESLIAEELLELADHMTPTQFLSLPMSRVYWPFALAALHRAPLALAAAAVAADLVPAGAFESPQSIPVTLFVDNGDGTFAEFRTIESRSNVNGLRYAMTVFLEPTRSLRIVFGAGPSVLRLDVLHLRLFVADAAEPIDISVPRSDGFDTLHVDRGVRVSDGIVIATSGGPALRIDVPGTAAAHRVELELAFAVLPFERLTPDSTVARELATKAVRAVGRRLRRRRSRPPGGSPGTA